MKTEFRHFSVLSAVFAALLGLALLTVSCQPEGLVDETLDFYYPDITDIGPSTNLNVEPNFHGGTPSDFQITNIRFESADAEKAGNEDLSQCFSVNPETGMFYIRNTDGLSAGKYYFSISAKFGSKVVEKKDVIVLNMMLAVPSGIKAEPDYLEVKLADVISGTNLPSSKIITEGEHVTIKKYLLGTVTKDGELFADAAKCFSVSDAGVVSIVPKADEIRSGKYVLDFVLTTSAADEASQKGLFEDALTINITSEPLSLTYSPDNTVIEVGFSGASSSVPVFVGSLDGLKYEIASVEPDAKVTIDENGVLAMPVDAAVEIGKSYVVSVKAINNFGEKEFTEVFTFNAIEFIDPITKFSYNEPEKIIESKALTVEVNEMDGKYVKYSLSEVPEALVDWLSIDENTGALSLPKGNTIYAGTYPVKVKAVNAKTEMEATVNIVIDPNVNFFTYVSYGNNLGEGYENEADQFRIPEAASYPMTFEIKSSDLKEGAKVKYSLVSGGRNLDETVGDQKVPVITLNEETGAITVEKEGVNISYLILQITAGEGEDAISIKTPVFFQFPGGLKGQLATDDTRIEFTPFVARINPMTGGTIPAPVFSGSSYVEDKFIMDYRRSFNYTNIYGPASHKNGASNGTDTFLKFMWDKYAALANVKVNYQAKEPCSWLGAKEANRGKQLLYVVQQGNDKNSIKVNPDMWIYDGEYANGIFMGQITFVNSGDESKVNNGSQIFPIAIWFDTKF